MNQRSPEYQAGQLAKIDKITRMALLAADISPVDVGNTLGDIRNASQGVELDLLTPQVWRRFTPDEIKVSMDFIKQNTPSLAQLENNTLYQHLQDQYKKALEKAEKGNGVSFIRPTESFLVRDFIESYGLWVGWLDFNVYGPFFRRVAVDTSGFNIFKPMEPLKKETGLFRKSIIVTPRVIEIGQIRFDYVITQTKKPLLQIDVYGRNNLEYLGDLGDDLAEEFKKTTYVKLIREKANIRVLSGTSYENLKIPI